MRRCSGGERFSFVGFHACQHRFEMRPLTEVEGGGYLVEFPDFPGCMADGATPEDALREAAGVFNRVLPEAWERFNTQSMLGAALEAQKKFAEAEPLLVSGYEEMSSRKPATNVRGRFTLNQAGEAVVKLYQDWGKPEKASEGKTRLAAVTQPTVSRPAVTRTW